MIKKYISAAAAVTMVMNMVPAMTGCVQAAGDIKVIYDGQELSMNTAPTIVDDTTLVPMRAIFEAFGAKVKWDGEAQTVTAKKKSKTVTMTIGSKEITKNDETVNSQTAPQIIDGSTMIPVRAVSELLGLNVEWDGENREVIITTPIDDEDEGWKDNIGTINLTDMTAGGEGISIGGNVITISKGGDYTVSGRNDNASIVVNAKDNDEKSKVKLRLKGAELTNPDGAAINVQAADKLYITLEDGTENAVSDGGEYTDTEVNGCIYSKDDIEIKGSGSLTVTGNYNHGISCNDSMEISNGNISITSKNDGIHVNDTMLISGGNIEINAEGDGISADEIFDITGGSVIITTTGGVAQSNNMQPMGGFGGRNRSAAAESAEGTSAAAASTAQVSTDTASEDTSSKGIKAGWMLTVNGGEAVVSSTDHAVHCSGEIELNSGELTLSSSAGKGISGHEDVRLNGTDINITNATEGIESKQILTMNDGTVNITCSDDGLNAGGEDTFGGGQMPQMQGITNMEPPQMPEDETGEMPMKPGRGNNGQMPEMSEDETGEMPMKPGRGNNGQMQEMPDGQMGGRQLSAENGEPPQMSEAENIQATQMSGGRGGMGASGGRSESTEISSTHHIQINGGTLIINANGDGIDSNGSLVIDGGYVVVNGPSNGGNCAIDHDGLCRINGGTLIAVGASGMIENPSGTSGNYVLSAYTSSSHNAGELVSICDSKGNTIVSIAPLKSYGHIMFSSEELQEGESYTLYEGGECSGTINSATGVYEGGTISGATESASAVTSADTKLVTIGTRSSLQGGLGRGNALDGGQPLTETKKKGENKNQIEEAN